MEINEQDIETRKAFLRFEDSDVRRLLRLHAALKDRHAAFAERFYGHVTAFEEMRAMFPYGRATERLVEAQTRYFGTLTSGTYDRAYALERFKIGITHQRIGLEPNWYIGAYGEYVNWAQGEIARISHDPDEVAATCAALFKIILYDIELVMDAYMQAAEEKLRLFQKVFENNVEAVAIVDADGAITQTNRMFSTLSGYDPKDVAGKSLRLLFSDTQSPPFDVLWERVRTTGSYRGEVTQRRADGSEFPTWMGISAVGGNEGRASHCVVEFSDITDYRRAQDDLARRTEELKRSNQELEQFAYVASHDLQEPLRMVASYTQLLARRYRDKLDADADEFILYAVEGATRMQTLISDLLSFSRVGTKGKPFARVDMERVLERALNNLRLAVDEGGADITHDPLPTISGDEGQLIQILQNFVGNALKFRGETAPRVHVGAERRDDEWVFSVKDNGIGIEPQFFERIFVIFQRLHRRAEYAGTGIGLALCKKIVERHKGRIWVESEPGKGSTFFFTIPIPTSRKGEN